MSELTTATTPAVPAPASRLLAKLMAVVSTQFRVDLLTPASGELVFNTDACRAPGCCGRPRVRGLCRGHYDRWGRLGRPDLEEFLTDPSATSTANPFI